MRALFGFLFASILTLPIVSGCGPHVTEQDLGTVVFEVPNVPGSDEPYELPDSGAGPASDAQPEAADEDS